jgi:multiple antibiotic resistance protein
LSAAKSGEDADDHDDDPSVFPLAIPLIAGPGAIATVILLVGQTTGTAGYFAVMAVLAAVLALVFLMFLSAAALERMLGKTGITVVTRLLGMLLAALSVQFVLDGLRGFGLGG